MVLNLIADRVYGMTCSGGVELNYMPSLVLRKYAFLRQGMYVRGGRLKVRGGRRREAKTTAADATDAMHSCGND